MKNHRSLLLAVIIAVSCVFAYQPAGAMAVANAAAEKQACTNIGPQPLRIATVGLGVRAPQLTLANVQPCYVQDGYEAAPVASNDALSCATIGPTAERLLTVVGLGMSGSLMSMNPTACMLSANLLQPANQPDARVCSPATSSLKQCLMPD